MDQHFGDLRDPDPQGGIRFRRKKRKIKPVSEVKTELKEKM